MDNEKIIYTCSICKNETTVNKNGKIPICCEKEMLSDVLPHCTSAPHHEMSRNSSDDEPCDDGRGRK